MTVTETLIRKVFDLSESQQKKVLVFIEKLDDYPANDPYGICVDIRTDLSFDDFKRNRQMIWGKSTDEEI